MDEKKKKNTPLILEVQFTTLTTEKTFTRYEIIYQIDAIEYLFVFSQLNMFRAYTPIFRSNGCYRFFTYAAYSVL